MASPQRLKSGKWRYQPTGPGGRRLSFSLPSMPNKAAWLICNHIDSLIIARETGTSPDREVSAWLTKLGDSIHDQLVRESLIDPRKSATASEFISHQIQICDGKPDSKLRRRTFLKAFIEYYGTSRRLNTITPADAQQFQSWMLSGRERKFRPSTAGRYIGFSKQYFRLAIKLGYVESNPFDGLSSAVRSDPERMFMITREMTDKLLAACDDPQWRLLIVLARYAGLRVPSEIRGLRFDHFSEDRFLVRSPKTDRHAGGSFREPPIFDEIRPEFDAWRSVCPDPNGKVFSIPMKNNSALIKPMRKLIEAAGLELWPKLWTNFRSSCITDHLRRGTPQHLMDAWFGNSEQIRIGHYAQITDDDYNRYVSADQVQQGAAGRGKVGLLSFLTMPQAASEGICMQLSGRYWT